MTEVVFVTAAKAEVPAPPDPQAAPASIVLPLASNFTQSLVVVVPVDNCSLEPLPCSDVTPEIAISPAPLTVTGDVAVIAPPPELVTQVAQAITPAAEIVAGDVAVSAPPLVVVAQVEHAIVPVPVIVPPVIGGVVAMLVTDPILKNDPPFCEAWIVFVPELGQRMSMPAVGVGEVDPAVQQRAVTVEGQAAPSDPAEPICTVLPKVPVVPTLRLVPTLSLPPFMILPV